MLAVHTRDLRGAQGRGGGPRGRVVQVQLLTGRTVRTPEPGPGAARSVDTGWRPTGPGRRPTCGAACHPARQSGRRFHTERAHAEATTRESSPTRSHSVLLLHCLQAPPRDAAPTPGPGRAQCCSGRSGAGACFRLPLGRRATPGSRAPEPLIGPDVANQRGK